MYEIFFNTGSIFTFEGKKAETRVPNSVWETYSAFANTMGGIILFVAEEHLKEKDSDKRFTIANIENPQERCGGGESDRRRR